MILRILGLAATILLHSELLTAQTCDDWVRTQSPNQAGADATFLGGVDGVNDDDVWSVGWYRLDPAGGFEDHPFSIHWDGTQWNNIPVPSPPSSVNGPKAQLNDVTAVASDDVWAVGNYVPPGGVNTIETLAMRWDGSRWSQVDSPTAQIGSGSSFNAIDSKDGEIWAAGYTLGTSGTIALAARWNGSGWDEHLLPIINNGDHELRAIDIHSADEIWAAGGVGALGIPVVYRWDGSSWEEVLPRLNQNDYLGLSSIISFGPDNVWVGASRVDNFNFQYYVYLHYDGSGWTETQTVHPFHIPSFEGDDPNNFYSGGLGTLARFDGSQWSLVDSLEVDVWTISDITVLPSGTVIGSGNTYDTGTPESLTAQFVPCNDVLLGDMNLDKEVNLLDVAPFVDRISTGVYQAEGDINEDGVLNLLDVSGFVELLTS